MDTELKNEQIIPKTDKQESVNFSESTEQTNNWNQNHKIEQTLENKFPWDENKEKREQLIDIFKWIKNESNEDLILDYIKETKNLNFIKILRKNPEDRQKYLIDEIKTYKNHATDWLYRVVIS